MLGKFPGGPVRIVDKVAAHFGEQVAIREGWHEDWKGKDAADELAKEARPRVGGMPDQWLAGGRRRRVKLAERCERVRPEVLRAHLKVPRVGRAACARAGRPAGTGIGPTFCKDGWSAAPAA